VVLQETSVLNDEWQTQDDLYKKLDDEFGFEFDLCANESNTKCANWTSDVADWYPTIDTRNYSRYWMNPPYSRGNINKCMSAAVGLSEFGKIIVCLVRFDPTATWFKDFVDGVAKEVRMLDRRCRFKNAGASYNFPCCVVVYDSDERISRRPPTEYYLWGWK